MTQPVSNRGRFEDQRNIRTVVARFIDGDITVTQNQTTVRLPICKMPANGRIVSASLIPYVTVAAGTVNYAVGLDNGLQADPPAGTITIAATVGGSGGVTARQPIAMTIDTVNDHDTPAKGDWIMAKVVANGDPNMSFAVEVDIVSFGD